MCASAWGMNKTKRGPAPKSFLSGRRGVAPSQEGCRWGVGFLVAEARGCVGWLAMGWTDSWVTGPPCTRCCSGPTIGGRRWETGCCNGNREIQVQHHRGIQCNQRCTWHQAQLPSLSLPWVLMCQPAPRGCLILNSTPVLQKKCAISMAD